MKKATLDRFIKLGGYDIMHKKAGTWRGYPEAEKRTGLTRMTIHRVLKQYPVAPTKGLPKYVEDFEDAEGFKRFKMKFGRKTAFTTHRTILMKAWLYLGKKDPISWNKKDYEKIWYGEDSPFIYKWLGKGGAVPKGYAVAFRNMMRVTDRTNLLLEFKGTTLPSGGKKGWFLEDEDIIGILGKLEENETLMMLGLGITKGARFSSLVLGKPEQVNWKDLHMTDYEPKITKHVVRTVPRVMLDLLRRYIKDYQVQAQELLFTHKYSFYINQLQTAGKKAGIEKNVTTHIMKHTFVSQASRHGVSAEVISEQCETELRTLNEYYKAKNPKKVRHELLDEKLDVVSWQKWIEGLIPYFIENYERIKREGSKVDGIRSKL